MQKDNYLNKFVNTYILCLDIDKIPMQLCHLSDVKYGSEVFFFLTYETIKEDLFRKMRKRQNTKRNQSLVLQHKRIIYSF